MAEHPIQGLMGVTIEKIRDMVDTSTIIGDPIHVDDTTTIIPVSRVTFGFASGGSDVAPQSSKQMFGGGTPLLTAQCSSSSPAMVCNCSSVGRSPSYPYSSSKARLMITPLTSWILFLSFIFVVCIFVKE